MDDGRALLADLHRDDFQVAAAAWLHDAEYGRWNLYLVLPDRSGGRMGDALDRLYDSLKRLSPSELRFDHVRLVWSDEPLGVVLRSMAERTANRTPRIPIRLRYPDPTLPDCDDALVYPPAGRMTPAQVARAVVDSLGSDELVTVEQGDRVRRLKPVGVRRDSATGRLVVDAWSPDTAAVEHIPADDIADIYVR